MMQSKASIEAIRFMRFSAPFFQEAITIVNSLWRDAPQTISAPVPEFAAGQLE
jgi:hypothetical protein